MEKVLVSLGFVVRTTSVNGDQRTEVRLASPDCAVAWFRLDVRVSAGERIVSTTTQLICRDELSVEQVAAVKAWLHEQVCAAE